MGKDLRHPKKLWNRYGVKEVAACTPLAPLVLVDDMLHNENSLLYIGKRETAEIVVHPQPTPAEIKAYEDARRREVEANAVIEARMKAEREALTRQQEYDQMINHRLGENGNNR